jgi:hypothetical protein
MSDKLPNADSAKVESSKLTHYLMSLDHRDGKTKAMFFMRFGFSRLQVEVLELALLKHAATQPVVEVKHSEHGVKYVLECSVESPDQRNPCIRSVWIVDTGQLSPRLVTAHPN